MNNTLDLSIMSSYYEWPTHIWYDENDPRCQWVISTLGYWVHQYNSSFQDDWIAKAEQAGDHAKAKKLRHEKATIEPLPKTTTKELRDFTAAIQRFYGCYHKYLDGLRTEYFIVELE